MLEREFNDPRLNLYSLGDYGCLRLKADILISIEVHKVFKVFNFKLTATWVEAVGIWKG